MFKFKMKSTACKYWSTYVLVHLKNIESPDISKDIYNHMYQQILTFNLCTSSLSWSLSKRKDSKSSFSGMSVTLLI
jgi:hypothetical protein